MRTALLVPLALTLAVLLGPAGASDTPAPVTPASSVAPTPPASAVPPLPLPQPRPTDLELARRRMVQCRAHPEICEQQKKAEREKKEKGGQDAAAPEGNPR